MSQKPAPKPAPKPASDNKPAPSSPRKGPRALGGIAAAVAIASTALALWAQWPETPLPAGARIDRLVVEKSAHRLLAYQRGRLLKEYGVAVGPGLGAKQRAGDLRTPEGSYVIDWHNGASCCHQALHVSYPSARDRARAHQAGYSPGGDIMVHGLPNGMGWVGRAHQLRDWTLGCIAVTDAQIEELYWATPDGTPIEIRP